MGGGVICTREQKVLIHYEYETGPGSGEAGVKPPVSYSLKT